MNKFMIYPLLIMMLFAFFHLAVTATTLPNAIDEGNFTTGSGDFSNAIIEFVGGDNVRFDIWSISGLIAIVILAITISAMLGFSVLGSGFSIYSQRLVFNAILLGGLWMALMSMSASILFSNQLFTLLFFGLTAIFIVGFGVQAGGHAD